MNLFTYPELYPLKIDFERHTVSFLRMSRETYRNSVFLDERAQYIKANIELNLDDLLLVSESTALPNTRVHYILNTAFCGSTLLTRYFELLPSCFVLKEPRLLSQLAVQNGMSDRAWKECFRLCLRLLSRTYDANQIVVIKPLETCNRLGIQLLEHNFAATATFLTTPIRSFLLAILKSADRRNWIRKRARSVVSDVASSSCLSAVNTDTLDIPQMAAYLWLADSFLRRELLCSSNGHRVLALNGESLMESPKESLCAVARMFGLCLDERQLASMVDHPSTHKYSKDLSRPYDGSSRKLEMKELERCWGAEADAGIEWAMSHAGELLVSCENSNSNVVD
jgi:hypothetical protein